jgi:hypothetical protein
MIEQPSNPVTSTTVRRVAARLGLQVSRVRATRPADADSLGNGNWHVWTGDGHRFILRRYHTLRTEQDLSYESQVMAPGSARLVGAGHSRRTGCPRRAALGCDPVRRGPPTPDRDARHREQRGSILARLHGDLRDLELGQRPWFYRGCELDLVGAFQDWDAGVLALQAQRPDLAEWATAAMAKAKERDRLRSHSSRQPRLGVRACPDAPIA